VLACGTTALAQDVNGTIAGVITDQSGAVVRNTAVTAVNPGTGARYSPISDSKGAIRHPQHSRWNLRSHCTSRGFPAIEARAIRRK
jgi:hypothetical protein